jgi:siroheme synthase-like protein
MKTYPIFIKLDDEPVFIIGGGRVAFQKLPGLLEAGARATLIAIDFCPELLNLAEANKKQLTLIRKAFSPEQIKDARLVIAATNSAEVNKLVSETARKKSIPVNNVTNPGLGDFFLGSTLYRGDFCLAAQTGGKAPGFSKAFISDLEKNLGTELETLVNCIGDFRQELKARYTDPQKRISILTQLNYFELLDLLKKEGEVALKKKLNLPEPE